MELIKKMTQKSKIWTSEIIEDIRKSNSPTEPVNYTINRYFIDINASSHLTDEKTFYILERIFDKNNINTLYDLINSIYNHTLLLANGKEKNAVKIFIEKLKPSGVINEELYLKISNDVEYYRTIFCINQMSEKLEDNEILIQKSKEEIERLKVEISSYKPVIKESNQSKVYLINNNYELMKGNLEQNTKKLKELEDSYIELRKEINRLKTQIENHKNTSINTQEQ